MRVTGRLPKRSDHAPSSGENMNCIADHANPNRPVTAEARAKSPPSKLRIRSGSTGAIMPNARKSNPTMTMMKVKAARLGDSSEFGTAGDGTRIPPRKIVTGKGWRRKWNEEATGAATNKRNAPLAAGAEQGRASLLNGLWGVNYWLPAVSDDLAGAAATSVPSSIVYFLPAMKTDVSDLEPSPSALVE